MNLSLPHMSWRSSPGEGIVVRSTSGQLEWGSSDPWQYTLLVTLMLSSTLGPTHLRLFEGIPQLFLRLQKMEEVRRLPTS